MPNLAGLECLLTKAGVCASNQLNTVGFVKSNDEVDYADLRLCLMPIAANYDGSGGHEGHGETEYHPTGTSAMGIDDNAVVGEDLKVHGIAGLRVADASIMPQVVTANTNTATIMNGEKAADIIAG